MIRCVWEHNGDDTLLYAVDYPGAFARGESLKIAVGKLGREVGSYCRWGNLPAQLSEEVELIQQKDSGLHIRDADSDVLFSGEKEPLSMEEYLSLKHLVLRSAEDFQRLYDAVPDKEKSAQPQRRTFYGKVPVTAEEMYIHTRSVNAYYFAEIDVVADNEGSIRECRERGFAALERQPGFLQKPPCVGSYGEEWSLRKVLRRFLWHDRIHGKAMYRMAIKTFGAGSVPDVFCIEK